MEQNFDRRKSFRFPLNAQVVCHVKDTVFKGSVRDLSICGLFMRASERPPVSSKCDLEIVLHGDHSCLTIHELAGFVLRSDEQGVAIKFVDRLEWVALIPICFHKMQEQILDSNTSSS